MINPPQGGFINQVAMDGENRVRHVYKSRMSKYDDCCAVEVNAFYSTGF